MRKQLKSQRFSGLYTCKLLSLLSSSRSSCILLLTESKPCCSPALEGGAGRARGAGLELSIKSGVSADTPGSGEAPVQVLSTFRQLEVSVKRK